MLFARLLSSVKTGLARAWENRFRAIKTRAAAVAAEGVSSQEGYRRGYRDGYWDGTTDFVTILLDADRAVVRLRSKHQRALPTTWQALLEEEQ